MVGGKLISLNKIESISDITKYGYLGVDLFFLISGYVIFFSASSRTPTQFAVSRAVRLYPSFWIAILFTSFFSYFWGGELMSVSIEQILANLTMLAPYLGENYVDGVYWTLIFELTFYFIVFLMLLFGLQKKLESIFIIWSYIFLISYFFGFDKYTYLGGYYYYFILGSLFAMLKKKKSKMTILSLLITYILCVNFAMDMSIKKNIGLSIHIVYWIVTCFCMFFYVLNTRKVSSIKLPYSAQIGALTYPLYLIHAHFGYMFLNQFANESNKLLMYSLLLLIVFQYHF